MGAKVRLTRNRREVETVLGIREVVFIKGQNVPSDREMDGLDDDAGHVIAFWGKKAAGCARIRMLGKRAKLERMAVLREYRGKGVGKAMMEYMLGYCKRRKAKEVFLHSQCRATEFYGKFGFKARGEVFMDAGIEHIEMYLKLG